jgi:hypothetical protein
LSRRFQTTDKGNISKQPNLMAESGLYATERKKKSEWNKKKNNIHIPQQHIDIERWALTASSFPYKEPSKHKEKRQTEIAPLQKENQITIWFR